MRPVGLIARDTEWVELNRLVDAGPGLGVVYGPRRAGKSFLLDAVVAERGGWRYQAVGGTGRAQLADFGRALGERLGFGALSLGGWDDALRRVASLDLPLVVIDEYPYLADVIPELNGLVQRHVDARVGPTLVLCGSAMSTMNALVGPSSPLFGRASSIVVPGPLRGAELSALWEIQDPRKTLWVDTAVGGLPGYRPLVRGPRTLDRWIIDEVLRPSSPLLDAAEATLGVLPEPAAQATHRSVLDAIARGERTFSRIGRYVGIEATSLSRPVRALERAGLIVRVPDPLRQRRDLFDLADPHLRFWLNVIAPNRSLLSAGRAADIWPQVRDTTWPSQLVGPRWESAVRSHLVNTRVPQRGPLTVGVTSVSDRAGRTTHELDIVITEGDTVVAIGESKLRRLGTRDARRLSQIRELLGAPDAALILASATGVDVDAGADVMTIEPNDVYGSG